MLVSYYINISVYGMWMSQEAFREARLRSMGW